MTVRPNQLACVTANNLKRTLPMQERKAPPTYRSAPVRVISFHNSATQTEVTVGASMVTVMKSLAPGSSRQQSLLPVLNWVSYIFTQSCLLYFTHTFSMCAIVWYVSDHADCQCLSLSTSVTCCQRLNMITSMSDCQCLSRSTFVSDCLYKNVYICLIINV